MELIPILESGEPADLRGPLSAAAQNICSTSAGLYLKNGFKPPWIAYLARLGEDWVGTCAFKSPPRSGQIEIAYFTFPEFEGRRIATRMAGEMVKIAWAAQPDLVVTA